MALLGLQLYFGIDFSSFFRPCFFFLTFGPKTDPQETPQNEQILKRITPGALSGPLCERVIKKEQILEPLPPPMSQNHDKTTCFCMILHMPLELKMPPK